MSPRAKAQKVRPLGPSVDQWHRYFWIDADGNEYGPLTSVTTALATIPKPAIARAATRRTAEYVYDELEHVTGLQAVLDREQFAGAVGRVVWDEWQATATFGTAAHEAIGQWIESKGVVVPDSPDLRSFVRAYRQFAKDEGIRPEDIYALEGRVFNLTHLYAGSFDQDLRLRDKRTLLDVKTGNDTYDETQIQLAGYKGGEFVGKPGDATRHPMPPWEQYAVLHVRPAEFEGGHERGYELTFYDITPELVEVFTHAVYVRRWALEQERLYRERQKQERAS